MRQPAPLAEIVEQVVSIFQPQATAKGLTVRADLPADGSTEPSSRAQAEGLAKVLPPVKADPERIGQVLRNLLSNAVTYTSPGGEIAVAARAVGSEVEVSVRDTVIGIAPDQLPYVFERFYRADKSRARTTGGAGLGLAIVKQLVEAHGGRVWVESKIEQGTTFTFTSPAVETGTETVSA